MLQTLGVNQDDVFLDAGCAHNSVPAHVAQISSCVAWGIEYVPLRTYLGLNSFLDAITDKGNKGPLINKRVAYIRRDLFQFHHFSTTTVVYIFDEAMPPKLFAHNVKTCANSLNLKFILSFKASKQKSFHNTLLSYGFTKVAQLEVHKSVSGEGNTV
jgi:hypothetical protein